MDEECLRPGDPTDLSFLEKLNVNLNNHPHYISHMKADLQTQKIMGRDVSHEFYNLPFNLSLLSLIRLYVFRNSDWYITLAM